MGTHRRWTQRRNTLEKHLTEKFYGNSAYYGVVASNVEIHSFDFVFKLQANKEDLEASKFYKGVDVDEKSLVFWNLKGEDIVTSQRATLENLKIHPEPGPRKSPPRSGSRTSPPSDESEEKKNGGTTINVAKLREKMALLRSKQVEHTPEAGNTGSSCSTELSSEQQDLLTDKTEPIECDVEEKVECVKVDEEKENEGLFHLAQEAEPIVEKGEVSSPAVSITLVPRKAVARRLRRRKVLSERSNAPQDRNNNNNVPRIKRIRALHGQAKPRPLRRLPIAPITIPDVGTIPIVIGEEVVEIDNSSPESRRRRQERERRRERRQKKLAARKLRNNNNEPPMTARKLRRQPPIIIMKDAEEKTPDVDNRERQQREREQQLQKELWREKELRRAKEKELETTQLQKELWREKELRRAKEKELQTMREKELKENIEKQSREKELKEQLLSREMRAKELKRKEKKRKREHRKRRKRREDEKEAARKSGDVHFQRDTSSSPSTSSSNSSLWRKNELEGKSPRQKSASISPSNSKSSDTSSLSSSSSSYSVNHSTSRRRCTRSVRNPFDAYSRPSESRSSSQSPPRKRVLVSRVVEIIRGREEHYQQHSPKRRRRNRNVHRSSSDE